MTTFNIIKSLSFLAYIQNSRARPLAVLLELMVLAAPMATDGRFVLALPVLEHQQTRG
jgi:hypothetical protein